MKMHRSIKSISEIYYNELRCTNYLITNLVRRVKILCKRGLQYGKEI